MRSNAWRYDVTHTSLPEHQLPALLTQPCKPEWYPCRWLTGFWMEISPRPKWQDDSAAELDPECTWKIVLSPRGPIKFSERSRSTPHQFTRADLSRPSGPCSPLDRIGCSDTLSIVLRAQHAACTCRHALHAQDELSPEVYPAPNLLGTFCRRHRIGARTVS